MKKLLIMILVLCSLSIAQQLEYMMPVGYQSPFLKSGQYITSLYYYSHITETESMDGYADNWHKIGEYSINMIGWLGLTDHLTLATKLNFYPGQKIAWNGLEDGGSSKNNFNVSPEFTLSYRPIKNLEIFGSVFYQKTRTEYGAMSYMSNVPVGIDDDGNVIYEWRKYTLSNQPDLSTERFVTKIGITFSGKLW